MIRRPPRSTQSRSSAASDVYKRQLRNGALGGHPPLLRVLLVPGGAGLQRAQRPGSLGSYLACLVVDDGLGRRRRAVDRDDQLGSVAHAFGDTMILRPTRSLAARNASSALSSGCLLYTSPSPRD